LLLAYDLIAGDGNVHSMTTVIQTMIGEHQDSVVVVDMPAAEALAVDSAAVHSAHVEHL